MIENDRWLYAHAHQLGLDPAHVNPHSVDLCLGAQIIARHPDGPELSFTLGPDDDFTFLPGWFYLAHTAEYVCVPVTHRGQLLLKSSTARRGLNHLMAGYVDAGWHGRLTLEFVAHLPVRVTAGQRLVQIEYARLSGVPLRPYTETGRYCGAQTVQDAQPERGA